MKNLIVSAGVIAKLREKHGVTERGVEQCFENKCGMYLLDDREDHRTDPPTLWFLAPTNEDRLLKVVFMFVEGNVHLKSAFVPEQAAIDFYEKHGK